MHKALPCINHVSASHCYEHDGQRKRVAHMPTATTTEAASRFTIGVKAPTRLRDEALSMDICRVPFLSALARPFHCSVSASITVPYLKGKLRAKGRFL